MRVPVLLQRSPTALPCLLCLLACALAVGDQPPPTTSSSLRITASSPPSQKPGDSPPSYCRYDALLVHWEWRRSSVAAVSSQQEGGKELELWAALLEVEGDGDIADGDVAARALHRWSGVAELGLRRFGSQGRAGAAATAAAAAEARLVAASRARLKQRAQEQRSDDDEARRLRRQRRRRRKQERDAAAIECEVGGPACTPYVVTVAWNEDESQIEVNFDQATNAPSFAGSGHHDDGDDEEEEDMASRLSAVLSLQPMPSVLAAAPRWKEGARTLVV